jgi:histidinol phosphatase-like PHP family hydrolase
VEKNWDRLDFVLGSVHYFSGETEMLDRAGETAQIESRGEAKAFDQYVHELEKLISRGHIDCLSHLDLVKIHGLLPRDYDPVRLFQPILELAKKADLAIEVSTAGWRKAIGEQYPHASILKLAVALAIPITTASDAHSHFQVADNYPQLARVLDATGVSQTVTFRRHRWKSRSKPFRAASFPGQSAFPPSQCPAGGRVWRWPETNLNCPSEPLRSASARLLFVVQTPFRQGLFHCHRTVPC